MTKMKSNIEWGNVVAFRMVTSVIVAGCLVVAWIFQISEQETQNMNTEARCKSAGGEMGYSKCFKNGKEI